MKTRGYVQGEKETPHTFNRSKKPHDASFFLKKAKLAGTPEGVFCSLEHLSLFLLEGRSHTPKLCMRSFTGVQKAPLRIILAKKKHPNNSGLHHLTPFSPTEAKAREGAACRRVRTSSRGAPGGAPQPAREQKAARLRETPPGPSDRRRTARKLHPTATA